MYHKLQNVFRGLGVAKVAEAGPVGRRSHPGVGALLAAMLASLLVSGLCACSESPAATGPERAEAVGLPRVIATIGMVEDAVRAVAGDRANVSALMGADVDPHLYKPTRSDIQRLMEADIIFYNGLLLEGKMTDTLIRAATSGRRVHAVTELIDESTLLAPDSFEGHFDPHVWMDPSAWMAAVDVIADQLSSFDSAHAAAFEARRDAYKQDIAALDAYAQRVLSSVPEGQRVLVTAHDAFNYFGRRYGFEVVGIQGLSTESEAGVRDIEALVDLIVERKIGAVFVESTVSERNVNALVVGARSQGHEVVIGGELFSDAMGESGTYEGTYIGMIDHNVTTIARALGGEAPEGGMQGRLGTR